MIYMGDYADVADEFFVVHQPEYFRGLFEMGHLSLPASIAAFMK
jgi:hypothetical protein